MHIYSISILKLGCTLLLANEYKLYLELYHTSNIYAQSLNKSPNIWNMLVDYGYKLSYLCCTIDIIFEICIPFTYCYKHILYKPPITMHDNYLVKGLLHVNMHTI